MTKRDLFNAKNNGQKIENGLVIEVAEVGSFQDTDKDGNNVTVSALKTPGGDIYTSISATIANSLDMLSDIIADEGAVKVKVVQNKSNGGREFYQLAIID